MARNRKLGSQERISQACYRYHLTVHKVKYDEQENVDTEIDPKYKLKISPDGLKELNSGKTTGNT